MEGLRRKEDFPIPPEPQMGKLLNSLNNYASGAAFLISHGFLGEEGVRSRLRGF